MYIFTTMDANATAYKKRVCSPPTAAKSDDTDAHVLAVTHGHRAIDVFDRIRVMEDGRIEEQENCLCSEKAVPEPSPWDKLNELK
ncbi:MAG: hypothetical protein IKB71_08970 [Lentisphaeria bacterium]|nr:hypothetical protein [Lentisphaeria bacterium]